jgi:DGQHR domain-containing protein
MPHKPKRDPLKVKEIQRSLDWKRVAQIAAYLLQAEIEDAPEVLDQVFSPIYEPRKNEPGREWPPRIKGIMGFQRSSFPFFSNVLVHVNGATLRQDRPAKGTAELELCPTSTDFYLTVIDGQHRINGAFLALRLRQKTHANAKWLIPAEVFLNLDPPKSPPVRQAQIFIDVNQNQKKVDRSLVADLFPLARGRRDSLDVKERAQDIGRKLMLETGPLVGMIQIPGIRYGVKDVVTLATLNGAIEGVLPVLDACDITNLEAQTSFLAQVLECWLLASGRAEQAGTAELDPQNVVYQGRILVSVIGLVPAVLKKIKEDRLPFVADRTRDDIASWFKDVISRAGLLEDGRFITREKFKELNFHGSGGIGRFRDRLWAASFRRTTLSDFDPKVIAEKANDVRGEVNRALGCNGD